MLGWVCSSRKSIKVVFNCITYSFFGRQNLGLQGHKYNGKYLIT